MYIFKISLTADINYLAQLATKGSNDYYCAVYEFLETPDLFVRTILIQQFPKNNRSYR